MNRALLLAINEYPDPTSRLRGCVNDVMAAAKALVELNLFKTEEIHLLTDRRATTAAILDRLRWLVGGASAGDKLLFWYSGHGTRLPLRDKNGDMISNECAICPWDFDWTPEHAIAMSGFREVFANIPDGVLFQWVSDSCHSGELTRQLVACDLAGWPFSYRRARQYPIPADMAWRAETWKASGGDSPGLSRAMPAHLHGSFLSGCRANQTSTEAYLGGDYRGALSYYLLTRLRADGLLVPLTQLRTNVNADLEAGGYEQDPELHGDPEHLNHGFLSGGV